MYDGEFMLTKHSDYLGLPLGVEQHLRSKPAGRPFTASGPGSPDLVEAAHEYLGETLVSAAMNYEHIGNSKGNAKGSETLTISLSLLLLVVLI